MDVKEYQREYQKKYRKANKEKLMAYKKKYLEKDPDYYRKRLRNWYERKGKEHAREYMRKYTSSPAFKEKRKIWNYAHNKLKKDLLNENAVCLDCGSKEKLQMHHRNYEEMNNVIVLCRKCHLQRHQSKCL